MGSADTDLRLGCGVSAADSLDPLGAASYYTRLGTGRTMTRIVDVGQLCLQRATGADPPDGWRISSPFLRRCGARGRGRCSTEVGTRDEQSQAQNVAVEGPRRAHRAVIQRSAPGSGARQEKMGMGEGGAYPYLSDRTL
jgi:hypothetical protein